jgi:predicted phage tail protein
MKTLRHILLALWCLAYMAIGETVTLQWDAAPDAVSWELSFGTDPAAMDTVLVATTPELTIPALAPGVYHFEVRAVGPSGLKSPPSNRITYAVLAPPAAPKNLRVKVTVTVEIAE